MTGFFHNKMVLGHAEEFDKRYFLPEFVLNDHVWWLHRRHVNCKHREEVPSSSMVVCGLWAGRARTESAGAVYPSAIKRSAPQLTPLSRRIIVIKGTMEPISLMSRVLICAAESRKQHLMSGRRPSDCDLSPSLAFSRSKSHPFNRLQ